MRTSFLLLMVVLALSGCTRSITMPEQHRPDPAQNVAISEPPSSEVEATPSPDVQDLAVAERWSVTVEDRVQTAALDPKGRFVAYILRWINPAGIGDTFCVRIAEARSGQEVSRIEVKGFPAISWSPDGKLALADDTGLRIFRFGEGPDSIIKVVGAPEWLSSTVIAVSPWFATPAYSLYRDDGTEIPLPEGVAPTKVTAVAALGDEVAIATETGELHRWTKGRWQELHRANAAILWIVWNERLGIAFYSGDDAYLVNDPKGTLVWNQAISYPRGQYRSESLDFVASELRVYQPESNTIARHAAGDGTTLPPIPLPKGATWLGSSQDGTVIVAGMPKADRLTQCILLNEKGRSLYEVALRSGGCQMGDNADSLLVWDEKSIELLDVGD